MDLPDIKEIHILKALLGDPHITRCAARLNLTQSAVSHTLNRLRTKFSDPLFIRSKNGLEPTSFLLSLEAHLDNLLSEAEAIKHFGLKFNPETSSRSFHIGMPELVSIPFIPKLLKRIRRQAPHVILNFSSITPQDATPPLENKNIDLYIGTVKTSSASLKSQLLYKESFICLTRKEYRIFKDSKISKSDYLAARHLKLSLQGSQPSYIDQALTALGATRKNSVTLPFYLLGFEVMRHEDLVMTAPKAMAAHVINEFSMQKFYKTAAFPYAIDSLPISQYWHIRSDKDAGHIWLRQMIKATGKEIAESLSGS